jgi:hypothetical protein
MSASIKSSQDLLARLEARIKTNREKDQEDLKEMGEEIKFCLAEMRSTVCAMWSDLKETIQHGMKVVIKPIKAGFDDTTNCNRATHTEPDPGMMQSIKEHLDIPKEDATVLPVGEPKRRHRVCNLAMERCQKRKERTWGYCGSRRKSEAACKRVSCCAKMAWPKRNLFRNVQTQRKYGQWKKLGTGERLNHHAEVARGKEHGLQSQVKKNSAPNTQKGQTFGKRCQVGLEGSTGAKDPSTRG